MALNPNVSGEYNLSYNRLCSMCGNVVKFAYINYEEKLLMCLNQYCTYPFGHGLTICTVDSLKRNTPQLKFDLNSEFNLKQLPSISKQCQVDDQSKLQRDQLKKDIESLNKHSFPEMLNNDSEDAIDDVQLLTNLKALQKISGKKLLKKDEMIKLRKTKQKGPGKLKVNIKNKTSMPKIILEIEE